MAFKFSTSKPVQQPKKTPSRKRGSFATYKQQQKKEEDLGAISKFLPSGDNSLVDLQYGRYQTINKNLYQYCNSCKKERTFAERYIEDALSSIVCINCGWEHKLQG